MLPGAIEAHNGPVYCSHCGHANPPGSAYCGSCNGMLFPERG